MPRPFSADDTALLHPFKARSVWRRQGAESWRMDVPRGVEEHNLAWGCIVRRLLEDVDNVLLWHCEEVMELLVQQLELPLVPSGFKADPVRRRRSQRRPKKQQRRQQQQEQQQQRGQPAAARQVEEEEEEEEEPEEESPAPQVCQTPAPARVVASQSAKIRTSNAEYAETGRIKQQGAGSEMKSKQPPDEPKSFDSIRRIFGANATRALKDHKSHLQRFVHSPLYEWLSFMLIIANAIFIGYQTESQAQQSRDCSKQEVVCDEPLYILFMSCTFTVLFATEVAVLWSAEGLLGFFRTVDLNFRLMDIIIVILSMAENFVSILSLLQNSDPESTLASMSALRMVRVLRVAKLAKVVRVMSFFRELRLMVHSILSSMQALLWVIFILGMTFYFFAITLTSGVVSQMDTDGRWNDPVTESLRNCFGSLGRSLLTLYMAITGGRDWGEFYHMLQAVAYQYQILFLMFLTFTMFALLNVVTGVFVDAATQGSQNNQQMIINEEMHAKRQYLKRLAEMFQQMDEDGNGTLTTSEFNDALRDDCVKAFFHALKLDVQDAVTLFKLLDVDQSGSISVDEFMEGCYELQGETRNIDAKIMKMQLAWLVEQVESLRQGTLTR